jgi:DNA repair exonuclease SbcCD ATPase subunit
MHILRLEVENVQRLEAVEITPDGNMVILGGANGAGKSSVLDAIEMALGGKSHISKVPLHRGAEKGHIILETEDYTVERTFTEKDSYIKVKTKDGYLSTPQELLNRLVGDLSFDPLAFTRMDSKKQANVFMNLLGLDFSKLDAEYKTVEDERRDIGRDGKAVKALLDSIPEDSDAPKAEVVVSQLMDELMKANEANDENEAVRMAAQNAQDDVDSETANVERLEGLLKDAKVRLEQSKLHLASTKKKAEGVTDIDTTPIREQINSAQATNERVQKAKKRDGYAAEYSTLSAQYKAKTARLEEITAEKATQIAAAKFPVPGVSFSDDGILVNELPFDQASSAEQLRIAVAMGLSADPKLRIILIRDGSLLDETSLAAVAAMAKQFEAQVWMERVGEGKEVSVVIKDGRVAEDRTVPQNDLRMEVAG